MTVRTVSEVAVGFGRVLRSCGFDAPVSSVMSFAGALEAVGVTRPAQVFWAGHASFVRRPEDTAPYAAAFTGFFGETGMVRPDESAAALTLLVDEETATDAIGDDRRDRSEQRLVRYSSTELLRERDFASCSRRELDQLYRLMASIRRAGPRRRARRLERTRHPRGSPDLRGTVRGALRTGGEAVRLHRRGPGERERPVVLLVDVSGSMEPYARAFLHFAHAAVAGRRRVEAFTLGTRLTHVTRELSWRDPDAAISRALGSVEDISGGTRLGEGLGAFNDRFGVAGMARGAVVVILSDGWDRGDPERISLEMARLQRVAHRVLWVNPLKASLGYAPLARGMAAALVHVDEFLEGHSLAALEKLIEVMRDER
jgi:hypothetical protein